MLSLLSCLSNYQKNLLNDNALLSLIPLLEKYMLSSNKKQFMQSLNTDIQSKKMIELILTPYHVNLFEQVKDINQSLLSQSSKLIILSSKVLELLRQTNDFTNLSQKQKKKIVQDIKCLYYNKSFQSNLLIKIDKQEQHRVSSERSRRRSRRGSRSDSDNDNESENENENGSENQNEGRNKNQSKNQNQSQSHRQDFVSSLKMQDKFNISQNSLNKSEIRFEYNRTQFYVDKIRENTKNIKKLSEQAFLFLLQNKHQQLLISSLNKKYLQLILNRKSIVPRLKKQTLLRLINHLIQKQKQTNVNFYLNQLKTQQIFQLTTLQQIEYIFININPQTLKYIHNMTFIKIWFNKKFYQQKNQLNYLFNQITLNNRQTLYIIKLNKIYNQILFQLNQFIKNHYQEQNITIKQLFQSINLYIKRLQYQILQIQLQLNQVQLDKLIKFIQQHKYYIKFNQFSDIFTKKIVQYYKTRQQYKNQNNKRQSDIKSQSSDFKNIKDNIFKIKLTFQEFIEKYIKTLYSTTINQDNQSKITNQLSNYFKLSYLQKLQLITKFNKGKQTYNLNNILTQLQYQTIKNTKFITITNNNHKIFSKITQVKLQLIVKNVKKFDIKIYQLKLEKYLLEKKFNLSLESIDLSYLEPNQIIKAYETNINNQFHQVKLIVDLPLDKKFGKYIVQFQEQQIVTKAIIHKGNIRHISKQTQQGYQIRFIDQTNNFTNQMNVWVSNRCHSLNNGKILIPYLQQQYQYPFKNLPLICTIGSYSQIIQIGIFKQTYQLTVGYLYTQQSFIINNKSKIIINPRLKCLKQNVNLQKLQNIKITLKLIDHLNIPTIEYYQNIKFSSFQDYEIEFNIKNYLKEVNIKIQGQIKLINGKKKLLSHQKQIRIQNNKQINQYQYQYYYDFYFDKISLNQYKVSLLGLNGQPIVNKQIQIIYKYIGFDKYDKITNIRTDQNGRIFLKNIQNIQANIYLSVQCQTANNQIKKYQKVFQLNNNSNCFNNQISVVNNINVKWNSNFIQGQKVIFNIDNNENCNKEQMIQQQKQYNISKIKYLFSCYRCVNQNSLQIIQNLTDKLLFQQKFIKINQQLKQGNYLLVYHNTHLNILNKYSKFHYFKIHKFNLLSHQNIKVYTENNNLNIHYFNKNQFNRINLGKIQINSNIISPDKGIHKIKIPINYQGQQQIDFSKIKSHVFITNYCSANFNGQFDQLQFTDYQQLLTNYYSAKESAYINNKKNTQETNYVKNRKKQSSMMGNTFQKPRLFLKRKQHKSQIIQIQEQLDIARSNRSCSASSCDQDDSDQSPQMLQRRRSCVQIDSENQISALQEQKKKKKLVSGTLKTNKQKLQQMKLRRQYRMKKRSRSNSISSSSSDSQKQQRKNLINKNQFRSHNNFLKNAIKVISNIKLKCIQFQIPSSYNYSQIIAYVISPFSSLSKKFQIYNSKQIKKESNDLRHQQKKSNYQNKQWGFEKKIYPIRTGQVKLINRNSQWQTIVTKDIFTFADIKGIKLPQWSKQILKWQQFNYQKKIQFYNQYYCHQLNSFIYFQDKEFFNKIVKPFISCKISKSIVDLCLLENPIIIKYVQNDFINLVDKLNFFEFILVINLLKKNNQNVKIKKIINFMQSKLKKQSNKQTQYQKYFDWIISQKQIQIKTIQEKQIVNNNNNNNNNKIKQSNLIFFSKKVEDPFNNSNNNVCNFLSKKSWHNNSQKDLKKIYQQQQNNNLIYKKDFNQIQKTKQYIEITYFNCKNPSETKHLIQTSPFWVQLAQHLLNQNNNNKSFLSQNFIYFQKSVQFITAASFLSLDIRAEYLIQNKNQFIEINPKNNFLIFIKQSKLISYKPKYGILSTQRIIDPSDKYQILQNGIKIQKQVSQFVINKSYSLQTIISNTSGTILNLKLIIDIPSNSIPLDGHEYTITKIFTLNSFSTISFERSFYFPLIGKFTLYPNTVLHLNQIISKSNKMKQTQILMKKSQKKQLNCLNDILKQGTQSDILKYIQKHNIHDQNIFNVQKIQKYLKNKKLFEQIIRLFNEKGYNSEQALLYGFIHQDIQSIKQYINLKNTKQQSLFTDSFNSLYTFIIPIFEYYPYNASRYHNNNFNNKYLISINNIRIKQFKQTYIKFILSVFLQNKIQQIQVKIIMVYYLILQDRVYEAKQIINNILKNKQNKQNQKFQLQLDYITCYLDMYHGQPNYNQARQIVKKYINYPIKSWRQLFQTISNTLNKYDNDLWIQEEIIGEKSEQYSTIFRNEGAKLYLKIPKQTKIQIYFYPLNLQLYFSQYPFSQLKSQTINVKPVKYIELISLQKQQQQLIERPNQFKDYIVQIYQTNNYNKNLHSLPKKITCFQWSNPNIQVKLNINEGNFQVFINGTKKSSCYCKIYAEYKTGMIKFYRDGYTDVKGCFKYALANIEQIKRFSICIVTQIGTKCLFAETPNMQDFF